MKWMLRKSFWKNFKFKYKLTVINENTLEEVVGIHVSKLNGLSVLLAACTAIFLVAALIIVFTPLRNYLPGYMNSEIRAQVVRNALRADSLAEALSRQNLYIMNVRDIISGRVKTDTIASMDSLTSIRTEELMSRSQEEERFRKEYERKERYNLRAVPERTVTGGLIFYRPSRGVITVGFKPEEKHYGVDLAMESGGSVLSVLDGTVVFTAYTVEYGYVIQVQHVQNFMTVYKNCGSLMKEVGDKVKGGDVIALAGKSDGRHLEPHLHFELWHRGQAVDPAKYIVF